MSNKPCRVLVVDDHPDAAETLAFLLKSSGHDAAFLTNPYEVFALVDRMKPHIIFLDIGMPGLNGWEVAKKIRERFPSGGEGVRLVAITGFVGDEARINSRKAGFDAHLTKPISPDLVEAIIQQFSPCG